MNIKMVILLKDSVYASRLFYYFDSHYSCDLEMSLFDDFADLQSEIEKGTCFDVAVFDVPKEEVDESISCPVGMKRIFLTEEKKEVNYKGNDLSVFKYQNAELIYKAILNVCADSNKFTFSGPKNENVTVYSFVSVGGGAGASMIAASFACSIADRKKVLYLNLEKYGNAGLYFNGEGNFSMDDIIYALKSKRGALQLKLESAVKKSAEGVYFFSAGRNAYDFNNLTTDEMEQLLRGIIDGGMYDTIVLDMESAQDDTFFTCVKQCDCVTVVVDGSATGVEKFSRYMEALKIEENRRQIAILSKIRVLYNKFSNKTGKEVREKSIAVIGGIPKYEQMDEKTLLRNLSQHNVMNEIEL